MAPDQSSRPIALAPLLALLGLAAGVALLLVVALDTAGEEYSVDIQGFAFRPDELTINMTDTVTWTNRDSATHTATDDNGTFDSGDLGQGDSWSYQFDNPGVYDYHCTYHGSMTGRITVLDNGSGDSDEWFYDWGYELEDLDEDGKDDTITIGYDPDTEANETDIEVVIDIWLEENLHDTLSETYTIHGEDGVWFDQEWGADENGTYTFEVYLYDEQDNLEDNFTISNITLHARGAVVRDDTINVDVASLDDDDDGLINDLSFFAHIEDEEVDDVLIRLFVGGVFYAENTTGENGEAMFSDLPDADYLWDAHYNGSQLLHEGGLNHIEVALGRGAVGYLFDHDDNDDYDDFLAQVWDDEMEGDPDGYVEVYDENNTLIASGNTNDSAGWWDNVFVVYDLARANYTFYVWMEEGGALLQNGSIHSYGDKGKSDSDEWFEDIYYELSDSDGDGANDTLTLIYDVDTTTSEMEVEVEMNIYDSDGDWVDSDYDDFTVFNGTVAYRNMSWTANREDNYTFRIQLYDENWTIEDSVTYSDIHLGEGEQQGGDSNEWFTDIYLELSDSDGDGRNDTATVHFEVDTDNTTAVDVDTYLSVYDSDGDWAGWDWDSHTVVNGTVEWRSLTFTADDDDYYDLEVELYDDDNNLEDYAAFDEVWLYSTNDTGGGNDTKEWFYDWNYELEDDNEDGEDDTILIGYDPDTEADEMDIEVVVNIYLDGDRYAVQRQTHTIYDGEADWFEYYFTANETGTYDFLVDLYDDEDRWEDNFSIQDIFLTAEGGGGGQNQIPNASIDSVSPDPAVEGEAVTLEGSGSDPDGEVMAYRWESDLDGELGDEATLSLDDLSVGTHTISFQVRDDEGAWSEPAETSLRVHEQPVAFIDLVTPNPATLGDTVTFSGSGDDDGEVVAYQWLIDGTEASDSDTFTRADLTVGTYDVSFRVQDNDGVWSEPDTDTLTVNAPDNRAPTANGGNNLNAVVGEMVTFVGTGNDPDGTIELYEWDFDSDGVYDYTSTTSGTATHTYNTAGTYSARLRVTDDDGAVGYDTVTVLVETANAAPTATIVQISPNPAAEGRSVTFLGTGADTDGPVSAYQWLIDGAPASDSAAFTKDDLAPGRYNVSLRVQDDLGLWSQWTNDTLEITVAEDNGAEEEGPLPGPGLAAALMALGLAGLTFRRRS